MPFCPKCGAMVYPTNQFRCLKCGTEAKPQGSRPIVQAREEREVLVLDDADRAKLEIMPKMRAECPRCGHTEAYYRTQQTRKSDEPETTFLRCVKCDNRWRKY